MDFYHFQILILLRANQLDRLKEYFLNVKEITIPFIAFSPFNDFDIYNLNALHHPLKVGYNDWAIVLACSAEGYLISDPNTLYVYDNEN